MAGGRKEQEDRQRSGTTASEVFVSTTSKDCTDQRPLHSKRPPYWTDSSNNRGETESRLGALRRVLHSHHTRERRTESASNALTEYHEFRREEASPGWAALREASTSCAPEASRRKPKGVLQRISIKLLRGDGPAGQSSKESGAASSTLEGQETRGRMGDASKAECSTTTTATTTPRTFSDAMTVGQKFRGLPKGSTAAAAHRGLITTPVLTSSTLPSCLTGAVEILPGRLYWTTLAGNSYQYLPDYHIFCVDDDFIYEPFFADFGPLNLGQTYRFCQLLVGKLTDRSLASKRIVQFTSPDFHKRANAAYLMVAFCVVILGWTPEAASAQFDRLRLLGYRDATYGACSYLLKIADCAEGLNHAIGLGWFDFDSFDINDYEFYERLENGDVNWIVPKKFLAFSGPEGRRSGENSMPAFTPEDYVPIFRRLGVKLVVRLNKRQYDRKVFTSHGIDHVDLYFVDGSCPSRELIARFLDVTEKTSGAVAVHCKAGLGRTGTLIGCYAIKHYGFTGDSWIAWNRICRPGSVLGPQQHFLSEIAKELREAHPVPSLPAIEDATDLRGLLQEMTLDEKRTATLGDSGQGARLVHARRLKDLKDPGGQVSGLKPGWQRRADDSAEDLVLTPDKKDAPMSFTPTSLAGPLSTLSKRAQPEETKGISDRHYSGLFIVASEANGSG